MTVGMAQVESGCPANVAGERLGKMGNDKDDATRLQRGSEVNDETNHDVVVTKEKKKRKHRQRARIPVVNVEGPTPSPRPASTEDTNLNKWVLEQDEEEDEEDEDDDDLDDEIGEEEEVEEEEEDLEMTSEEKKAMYLSVMSGDIDRLEDCLDKPNADINMIWFQENLLMAAIRAGDQEMAEFLLDNGVDHTFTASLVVLQDTTRGKSLDRYQVDCRQMAYDRDLLEIVQLIDYLQGKLFSFIPAPQRTPRYRRPKPPTPEDSTRKSYVSSSNSSEADVSDTASDTSKDRHDVDGTVVVKQKRRKKRRRCAKARVDSSGNMDDSKYNGDGFHEDDDVDDKDRTTATESAFGDVDSGVHSMASSKLKKATLREHDRLVEQEELLGGGDAPSASERAASTKKSFSDGDLLEGKSPRDGKSDGMSTSPTNDEGYGTVSIKTLTPCVSPENKPQWHRILNEPTNNIRSNKAALALKRSNQHRKYLSTHARTSFRDKPMHWRKVSTPGSYAKESRHWHNQDENIGDELTVEISQLHLSASPAFSTTTTTTSTTTTIPLSTSSIPSRMVSRNNSPAASLATTSLSSSQSRASSSLSSSSTSTKGQAANYMKPTKSTITKQRLSSKFVSSYGGLKFSAGSLVPTRLSHSGDILCRQNPINRGLSRSAVSASSCTPGTLQADVATINHNNCVPRRTHHTISFRK